jgi:hypothetical protein
LIGCLPLNSASTTVIFRIRYSSSCGVGEAEKQRRLSGETGRFGALQK